MAEIPENGPIDISYNYPDLNLELTLKADHPRINHASRDEREMIRIILGSFTSEALRLVDAKPYLESIGRSVLNELVYIQSLSEVIHGRIEEARIEALAKQADQVWAARRQTPPQ